ncbi:hydrolase [Streptomyces sp. MP131-18]|uniref:hydrolase n=1 Tax=Streptomyces sp. MP131-18 TaxID=1857892 RepID=UPI00097C46F1|nr:hydrolase [Streptomyces sp. MP131-18]ONK12107.1 N-isopropylammelide isopropyl amidohydrolase [Streptomyces sp. MP131-18]
MPERLVLSGPRLADGRTVDVRLRHGRIEAVGTPGSLSAAASDSAPGAAAGGHVDLSGHLLLPAPAEPHAHHDTALTGDATAPPEQDLHPLRRRITEAALIQLGHGATAQRTHVRVDGAGGLTALDAALGTRRALRGLVDLTTVAVPQVLTGRAGADNRARLREAAEMGAHALGGCPDLDPDPAGHLDTVLGLADTFGRPVDLHTEGEDPARLARLASAAAACRSAVAIGPCTGLSRLPGPLAARAAERLAAAGVAVICVPQGACAHTARPAGAAATPVALLAAAGVPVAAGGGALRDTANPVGRGDPLEAAFLLAARRECGADDAYGAVSRRARAALGLPEVRVEAGFPAELLAVRGDSVAGVLSQGYTRLVIHRGRIVARTSAVREFCGAPAGGLELPRQATG